MMKRVFLVGLLTVLIALSFEGGILNANTDCEGSVADCLESDSSSNQNENDEPTDDLSPDDSNNESNEDENAVGSSNQSLFLDFLRMIAALVLVLALLYVVLKFIQKRTRNYQQTRAMENIGGVALGHNKSAQIVRVGDDFYLVGVGENVEFLTQIENPDTIDQLIQSPEEASGNASFQSFLQNFQSKKRNTYQEAETKNQFKTELETMKNSRKRMMKRYQGKDDRHDE
ncbi:flagellar protein FliO/FliZ [Alkalibacillus flavidus]|uniref:Flagellar protein FliO/FliZ n=1 Tax=Alkalibacillus flavidus TaxID=546021 RepID=A0ABV2KRD9_9BACI